MTTCYERELADTIEAENRRRRLAPCRYCGGNSYYNRVCRKRRCVEAYAADQPERAKDAA